MRRKAPLFLSEAWCDYERPLESRIKILEDKLGYRDEASGWNADTELSDALSLTMQSLQTLNRLAAPTPARGGLIEVAGGRPYELSSAFGTSSETGVVQPRGSYFFHTKIGQSEWIRVDLGQSQPVRRIEVTNRQNGHQGRAKHIFALLSDDEAGDGARSVFPMSAIGELPDGAWQECGIDLPEVMARYVTITSPLKTALHFFDLRVYAAEPEPAPEPEVRSGLRSRARSEVGRALRSLKRRARRLRASR